MGISRFSKPVNPAKFNPLSAEQIMKVPQMKGALEQQQIKSIEDARFKLFNADIAPGDKERVLKEQERLSTNFDYLIDNIRDKGVGYKTTQNINSFLKEYNSSVSKTGIVGGAAEFAKQRKIERKASRDTAIRNKYDMSEFSRMENIFDASQTSFDKEGIATGQEYEGLYLPNQIDPVKMLEERAKNLGYKQTTDQYGEQARTNRAAIDQAINIVYSDFNNKDSYKKLLELSGQDNESAKIEIFKQIERKGESMLQTINKEAPYVVPKESAEAKAARKAKAAEDLQANEANLVSVSEGPLRASPYDVTAAGEQEIIDEHGLDSEEYLNYKNYKERTIDKFDATEGAINSDRIIQEAKDRLIQSPSQGEYVTDSQERVDKKLQELEDIEDDIYSKREAQIVDHKKRSDPNPPASYVKREFTVASGNGIYKIFTKGDQAFDDIKREEANKAALFEGFAGENARHFYGKEFSLNEPSLSGSGANKAQYAKQQGILHNAITNQDNSTVVSMVEHTSKDGVVIESKDLQDTKDPENVEMNTLLTGLLKGNPKISRVTQQLQSEYNNPMVHYELTKGDKTYNVSIEMKDVSKEQSSIVQAFSKSLGAINKESAAIAESFAAKVAQKNIKTRYKKGSDETDAGLLDYTRTASGQPRVMQQMNKGPKKGGGINIVANRKGFELVSTVNGQDLPLTESELLGSLGFDFDQELSDGEWVNYIKEFFPNNDNLKGFLLKKMQQLSIDRQLPNLSFQDGLGILSQSEQSYTADSKEQLLQVIRS